MSCPICKRRASTHLAWYAAPECAPRGLRTVCLMCANAAKDHPVAGYVFYFEPIADAARVLHRREWSMSDRNLLLRLMN